MFGSSQRSQSVRSASLAAVRRYRASVVKSWVVSDTASLPPVTRVSEPRPEREVGTAPLRVSRAVLLVFGGEFGAETPRAPLDGAMSTPGPEALSRAVRSGSLPRPARAFLVGRTKRSRGRYRRG